MGKKPRVQIILTHEAIELVDDLAQSQGTSRSAMIERLIRMAPMMLVRPRQLPLQHRTDGITRARTRRTASAK